jgi:hypothetical protein
MLVYVEQSQSRGQLVYREWSRSRQSSSLLPCELTPLLVLLACLSAHHLLLTYLLKNSQESVPLPNASLSTTYLNLHSNALVRSPLVQLQSPNTSQSQSISTRVKKIARPRISPNSISPSTPPSYARVLFAISLTPRAHQRMRLCIIPIAQGFRGVCSGVVTKKGQHLRLRSPRSLPA